MAAAESYPDGLRYHPEHDWARIDGDCALLGITWYAQESLGEIVFFDPPRKEERHDPPRSVLHVSR